MAPETADVEVAEPQVPERPPLPIQDVRLTNDDILQTDEAPNFIPSDSSDSSADTACGNSVYLSDFPTAVNCESPQAQSSSANLTFFVILDRACTSGLSWVSHSKKNYCQKCALFRLVSELLRRIS